MAGGCDDGWCTDGRHAKLLALGLYLTGPDPRRGRATPLSTREEQVAALVADRFSNRQIASRLHIAERTENHVQNILKKLGFDSRARIASWFAGRLRDH